MKQLLLLILCGLTLVSCSKDEDNKGFLTDLESVKSGILGIWRVENFSESKSYLKFKSSTSFTISDDPDFTTAGKPRSCSIEEVDGKYYINTIYVIAKGQIVELNESRMRLQREVDEKIIELVYTRIMKY